MVLKPIIRCWRFFTFSLAANLLCIDTLDGVSFHVLSIPFLTLYLICLPVSFLPRQMRTFLLLLLSVVVDTACLVDVYCQEFFGCKISPQIVGLIMQTDGREISDFVSAYLYWSVFLRWRIVLLIVIIVLQTFSFFLNSSFIIPTKYAKWGRLTSVFCIFVIIVIELPAQIKFAKLVTSSDSIQEIEGMTFSKYTAGAESPMHRLTFSISVFNHTKRLLNEIKSTTLTAKIDSCSNLSPHIILLIGETYNKHHSQLYGYTLPTTPFQMERYRHGEMTVFKDVVTPWNITSNVFTCSFSMWHYGDTSSMGNFPLFPILFKKAGYQVRFFSNQYLQEGFHRLGTNLSGGFFLGDSALSDSLFDYRNTNPSLFDMGLVRQYAQYRDYMPDAPYTLDILHFIGQHFDYRSRYPKSAAWFHQKDYKNRKLDNDQKELVAAYDNATRYNDLVIDSVLSIVKKEDAIVVFMADHGEEIFDDLPIRGRVFQEPTDRHIHQEFEVPFWIWCSPVYRQLHHDMVKRISTSANRPFMTDDLPQLLLYLAGIYSKWTIPSNCLISEKYDSLRPRILYGRVLVSDNIDKKRP